MDRETAGLPLPEVGLAARVHGGKGPASDHSLGHDRHPPDWSTQASPALSASSHCKEAGRQGVPCLEVEWMRQDNATEDNPYYTTIEEEDKFTQCFSETMGLFEGMEKARKVSKGRKKVKPDKAHSKAPAEEDDMVSLVAERLNNLDLDIKISEVMLSDYSAKVNCEKSDAMSAGNEDFPPRIQTLKRNTRVTVKSGQDEQVYDSAIVNGKVKTNMENSSSGTLTELSARNFESSDDDSVSEYIPLSQRIKMVAMKDSCVKVKTTQGERQNKPDFVTEKMGNSPRQKQKVENDTFTRSDDDVKGTDHRLIGHDAHLSETSSPVAAEDHNQANVSNSRPTIIIISTAGGDKSDQHLSSPQKIVNLSSEKVVGFSDSDAGNGSVYELFSPDGDASLVRGDGDSLLGTAEVNALVTDETVRTSDVITITCVPEDASGMEPDQSILCTCDNSIDLFSSESVCASPQIMDNKIYTNRGNPFSSPDLSSGLTRMLSPSLQQNHEQGNSIKDGLLRSSPGIPHDLSSMKVFLNDSGVNTVSTPQTSSVKLRERVPFDSPDLCSISPGYGYFYLETSLLNDTTGSQIREPLTPTTCNKEMKVQPTRIECEKKSAECDNDDILVTLSKTADMVGPVEVNAVDCGKESKETVTKARSPLNEMCYASICTSKNLNKTKQLCQCSEGFDLHKDNLHTQNVSKSIVSAVSSILSTSCQPVSADISKQSSICKELSSGKENKLTRKTKKQGKSNCSSKSTQKIEEPDHVDFCIDKIAKLHVKENASDLNPTSPLALVDRLKSKFASLGTVPISGETILSVKKVNSK
ncbi:uncharacterized protein LOC135468843 isoform X1 [Liolophura sinensis]|uniref:uncharacterized protein LOC135468843 isoform X1 n=1 Tax=Liolophura sinensis TaxID=3198878 RepID=UPI003158EB50